MKAIKILFIMTLSLNAISVNRALFDLKDSQLKGELTPKIVNFGGYKSSTKEWGASALNYINAANGDAKKFSTLVEKMRFNSGILGNFRAHARLRQALKLQKNLKYCLKIIARDSFYSYRTGIYIPLGISLKDQKTAQKMLADLSVVGAYLKKQQENEKAQSPYYRSNNYYNSYYSPYYGMYGMGMYGMYGMGMYDFYDFYDGMYGFYPNMFFMMQVQDYLMLENYMYALDQEEILDHDASINQLDTPTDDDRDDKDDKDDKSLQQANLMSFYRDPKFSKGIQTNRLNSALVNLDNSRMLKDNSLFHTKAMPTKSVDAITSQAKELNHLVGQIKEMKQDGASPNKIDSVVNKAMEVRDKLDNNLNQLDNDLKDQKGLSSEQQAQVDKALDSVQQLSHSSDVVGNYLDGSLKIDGDDRDDLNDAMNNPMQQPVQQTLTSNMDNTHANDSKDQGSNALINPNNTTNDDHNDDHMDTNTTDTGNANDTPTDDKDASGNNTGDMNSTDTGNTDTGNTDDMSNMNNGNDDVGNANDDMGNSNDMGDDMNNANDMSDDMGNGNDDMGDMGDMNDDMGGDMGDMGDMGGDMGN
ncbi:dentin sialophosphopreproprotein [Helicobacter pylori]|uniref:Dentin sialophosphopreproprotein n=1 Tax=Helicobacter pylori TaxID=210 RepID=A0ABD4B6Z2_HELPX|nr:dentin sialophosphopreproprotein [Helicobacter pylori]KOS34654.1 dentin sialophosphopreproprotein [Helicobacter pylori]